MAKQGIDIINSLKQKWIGYQLLADVILAAAYALFAIAILHWLLPISGWWSVFIFVIVGCVLLYLRRPWQITSLTVAAFLNQHYPILEESAELAIKSPDELNLLQRLQLSKVDSALSKIPALPKQFTIHLKRALLLVIVAVIVFITANKFAHHSYVSNSLFSNNQQQKVSPPEKVLPQIDAVDLTITPPAYTGKPKRSQDKFTLLAEDGSTVTWEISTNIALKQISLVFNDNERIPLKPSTDHTKWTVQKNINKPSFYQVDVDGKLSDLYQIEIIKDNAPQIRVKTPKQYTYIDAGETPKVLLNTTLTDDYGISNAMIYATVAKGSGEAVKFKEYKIGFGDSFAAHKPQYELQHLFDLPKLDMEPGDELYFYIEATDNHQQKTRTDVYTVSIQDTAALLSMNGLVNGANIKPEYFRSQRQIIMDTEQLLKQKDSLNKDNFNSTCNNIGMDQKLLRLRYGKFLGEEDESNVGGLAENTELNKIENFNNAAMLFDAITDKHDNAEDATFLEPAIKAQLKATLTEMWNAELRLRLYKPLEALPFEYKALRLLKDLQQKSRAYVAKTAYNPSPIKLEKRLTGDLSKITQPINKDNIKAKADQFETLKTAIQLLEQIKTTRLYSNNDKHVLQLAKQQLSVKASAQPGIYLPAVNAINRILSATNPQLQDIDLVERSIQKTLPISAQLPQSNSARSDMGLAQHYYQNIKNNR
jgi:hypothetical protein